MSEALRQAIRCIAVEVGEVPPGGNGKATCPTCKTRLHWSRSRSGRTVWVCCDTIGCVLGHFQTDPRGTWPGLHYMEAAGNA